MFLPTEIIVIIAEIVGLYRGFTYDEQAEWLHVTPYISGVKEEAGVRIKTLLTLQKRVGQHGCIAA